VKRFDLPGFRPQSDWVRERVRYGVLPAGGGSAEDAPDPKAGEPREGRSRWSVRERPERGRAGQIVPALRASTIL
jgi:hypothetical protein